MVDDEELLDLVEMEVENCSTSMNSLRRHTDNRGSALMALEDPAGEWGDKIVELFEAIGRIYPRAAER